MKIDVTLELITPGYIGGADKYHKTGPSSKPEDYIHPGELLRPPELKAALRFWWRTQFPHLSSDQLFLKEEQLFGSARAGQGLRVVITSRQDETLETPALYRPSATNPLFYMAYGVNGSSLGREDMLFDDPFPGLPGRKVTIKRERLRAGAKYGVRLFLPRRIWTPPQPPQPEALTAPNDAQRDEWLTELKNALWLLSMFGGLGGRSRRGWGGLQVVTGLDGWTPAMTNALQVQDTSPTSLNATLSTGLKSLFTVKHPDYPDHAAFNRSAHVYVGPPELTWEAALIAAAKIYYEYRRMLGTTFNHTANNEPHGADFVTMTQTLPYASPADPTPDSTIGSALGLPHNYQFSDRTRSQIEVHDPVGEKTRRASPLFFKVVKELTHQGVKYRPVVLWLPSLFLPHNYSVVWHQGASQLVLNSPPSNQAPKDLLTGNVHMQRYDPGGTPLTAPAATTFIGLKKRPGWLEVTW